MTCGEVFWNIIIGLLTGGISGYIVSRFFELKANKKESQYRFEKEKEELASFLHHVFDELIIVEQRRDVSRLIWILGTEPFCDSLKESDDEKTNYLLKQIEEIIEDIRTFCFCRIDNEPFSNDEIKTIVNWSNKAVQLARRVGDLSLK